VFGCGGMAFSEVDLKPFVRVCSSLPGELLGAPRCNLPCGCAGPGAYRRRLAVLELGQQDLVIERVVQPPVGSKDTPWAGDGQM
jgi:hypothetical protein